jgi:hypothetical protein
MRKTLLSLVLGCVMATFFGAAAMACEYHSVSASSGSTPPQQTAASGQTSDDTNN